MRSVPIPFACWKSKAPMKRLLRLAYFGVLLLIGTNASGQFLKNGSLWYFGYNVGVDFKTDPPTVTEDGKVFNFFRRSCAISDSDGNLLFYTDGEKAWDRRHQLMPNGTNLTLGLNFHTTPSIITPHPGDPALYYIFTANAWNGTSLSGLHYAIVDLSSNGGYGDVVSKNVNLLNPSTILLSSVNHADDKGYWIMGHEWQTNKFYAYHITEAGISPPVISAIGAIHDWDLGSGFLEPDQMCFSPDGTKLAVAAGGKIQLFDFNSITGKVTNARTIGISGDSFNGVAFSPNSLLLYASSGGYSIYQMDVSEATANGIQSSIIKVGSVLRNILTDLQLAYNGKIYCGRGGGDCCQPLIVIHSPNTRGVECGFDKDGLVIPNDATYGLPMSVQSFHRDPITIQTLPSCVGEATDIYVTSLGYADSIRWDYGDGTHGQFLDVSISHTAHHYLQAGNFMVTLTKYIGGIERSITGQTSVHTMPLPFLGQDVTICEGDTVTLSAGSATNFQWSTKDTTPKLEVTKTGTYWLDVSNGVCTKRDSIDIQVLTYPNINLATQYISCDESEIQISVAFNENYEYHWSSGENSHSIVANEPGDYTLTVSNQECRTQAITSVFFEGIGDLKVQPESYTVNHESEIVSLTVSGVRNANHFEWEFGDNERGVGPAVEHHFSRAGVYYGKVLAENNFGCSAEAQFIVTVPLFEFIPNVFTPNADGKNDAFEIIFNGDLSRYRLRIFNRLGKLVFETTEFSDLWKGIDVSPGTYYFEVQLEGKSRKGWVQIML